MRIFAIDFSFLFSSFSFFASVNVLVVVVLYLLFLLLLNHSYTTNKGQVRNTHILLQKRGLVSRYGGGHALLPYINK